MSVWTHFKIKNNTKDSTVSIRRAVSHILNKTTGGEFSISKEPDELGWYDVHMCNDGYPAFNSIQSIISLCKRLDERSNVEVEITRLIMH